MSKTRSKLPEGALGAAQAIQQKGLKGKVNLVAFDADPDEIAALKKGLIQALVVQDPYKMGYLGVKNAVAATQGKKVKKRIDTGVTVVTKGNLHRERIQKLLNPEKRD
ncbi:substrate-binding domain-containing protein [Kroppenstedtia eburnea]|uniref:substrate-binding domain-containing protein n=1 Tax=Kroppenstedtia eburnea TaxID=714067 RepID=UPI003631DB0A